MSGPASYPQAPDTVDRIDTHGAIIFLAGDEAYKIKRAVAFDYMDFSTLEKRERICKHEYQLNRRFAPDLYLGTVPITWNPRGKLEIGGDGEPIEWAVKMRRFDQSQLLSNQASSGGITPDLIKSLAREITSFHRELQPVQTASGSRRIEAIIEELSVNFLELSGVVPKDDCEGFLSLSKRQLANCRGLLDARSEAGYVRRCHGDLHLANIVLQDGRPVLFDALEFDEELATTDLLYELAFLLMDLWHNDLKARANLLLNRYLFEMGGIDHHLGLRALPLFHGVRAGIRAMVTAQRPEQHPDETRNEVREAHRYLKDAINVLSPPPARLVAVGGLSGTGKSTLAAMLAPELGAIPGAIHIRSDLERKQLFGASETERLPQDCYSAEASRRVYAVVLQKAEAALSAGQAVVTDAVFAQSELRGEFEKVASQTNVPFTGLWLTAPEDVLKARVAGRCGDASDATPETVELQLGQNIGTIVWHLIDASGAPEDTLWAALEVCT